MTVVTWWCSLEKNVDEVTQLVSNTYCSWYMRVLSAEMDGQSPKNPE